MRMLILEIYIYSVHFYFNLLFNNRKCFFFFQNEFQIFFIFILLKIIMFF